MYFLDLKYYQHESNLNTSLRNKKMDPTFTDCSYIKNILYGGTADFFYFQEQFYNGKTP